MIADKKRALRLSSLVEKFSRLIGLEPAFNATDYWERRHRKHVGALTSVGHISLSQADNERDYAVKLSRMTAAIVRALGELGGKSVLDAGCGIGVLTSVLVEQGAEVHGVDVSETALSLAKERVPTADFECVALDRLPYRAAFDAVVSMDVLFHVVDDAKWKESICRLATAIKADGVIIIQEAFGMKGALHSPPHVRWRTVEEYRAALADAGLEICSTEEYMLPSEEVAKTILTINYQQRL